MTADNRLYDYSKAKFEEREEYATIIGLIKPGSSVVDFGCGSGSLLKLLQEQRNCKILGIEISKSGVEKAQLQGISAICRSIDEIQPDLEDKQFDYAICNVTLQMVMYPEVALCEMGRVATQQIVAIPNFAHFTNRIDLLLHGRMPRPVLFGYEWYTTGHIHQMSFSDFEALCETNKFKVVEKRLVGLPRSLWKRWLCEKWPNLFGLICVYRLEHE